MVDTAELARTYLDNLLAAQRHAAFEVVMARVESGLPVTSVYMEVLQPVMYEVGRLWQVNEIDVPTEHYCTAATQLLMARLFPYVLERKGSGRSMVGCCLGSELHELGMRMVCDFFEFEGWDTYFMGAITPGPGLVKTVVERKPHLVCLSATMSRGVPQIKEAIDALRRELGDALPKIMVGGLAFLMNPDLSHRVGADGMASDARSATRMASELVPVSTAYA